MDNENFTSVYNYVSQQAEGATIAAAAAATLLTEEEVASFFAEPAAAVLHNLRVIKGGEEG